MAIQEQEATSAAIAAMWSRAGDFEAVLPGHVDVKSFLGTTAGALYASKDLMDAAQADPESLIIAMMRCATLGHLPGTEEYYLTPRKRKGNPYVLGIEGYRGVVERMYRSGAVARVVVREVCAADPFSFIEGIDAIPRHSTGGDGATGAGFFGQDGSRIRGQMVGVYAYAKLATGEFSQVVLLGRDDVLAARDAGGWTPDDIYSPWNRFDAGKGRPEFQGRSMWWKTAAKRLEPWVPTSAEYRREQLRASVAAAVTAGNGHAQQLPQAGPAAVTSPRREIAAPPGGQAAAPDPPRASSGQLTLIGRRLAMLEVEDDQRLSTIVTLAGRELAGTSELTRDEATHIKGLLDRCGDRAALVELLATGQLPEAGDGDA